jgi:cell division protein FtsN
LMEKQKIFWVVLSVTVFVVVVLVVGVFLLKQKTAPLAPTETVSPLSDTGTRIYEYSREAPQIAPQTAPQVPAPEAKPEQPEVMKITIGGNGTGKAQPEKAPIQGPKVVEAKPVPEAVRKPLQAPKKPSVSKPARPRTARVVEYWIQTGSYKSQSRAEDLSRLLESKGLPGKVFSKETYFRVRIGPYANKEEAGKFLDIVKQIQGLESSYISSVSTARYVN